MARLAIWRLAGDWRRSDAIDRSVMAPLLWSNGAQWRFCQGEGTETAETASRGDAVLLVCRGTLTADDVDFVRACNARDLPVFVMVAGPARPAEALRPLQGAVVAGLVLPDFWHPILGASGGGVDLPLSWVTCPPPSVAADALICGRLGLPLPASPPSVVSSPIICIARDPANVGRIAGALHRIGRKAPLNVTYAAPDPAGMARVLKANGLDGTAIALHGAELLPLLSQASLLLLPQGDAIDDDGACAGWARAALAHGVPVIADSHPALEPVADHLILDDWDRGLLLHCHSSPDEALRRFQAQEHVLHTCSSDQVVASWQAALGPAVQSATGKGRPRHRPRLLVQFDLGQDLDVLLPIVQAVRQRGNMDLRLVMTHWLQTESPRVWERLTGLGLDLTIVERKAARLGGAVDLRDIDAVITAAETTLSAHKAGHALTRQANSKGLQTYTVQHGFENVGLLYKDDQHGPEVGFASRTVFCWCPLDLIPDWVREETRDKLVPVGCSKSTPPPVGMAQLPLSRHWDRVVGVFENLHWHRYDDAYRQDFVSDLTLMAREQPDTLFLVKPHHAGRWLVKNPVLPTDLANLLLVDPTDPEWHDLTAPALLSALDAVITTPSTVALDAARAGRPVAVVAQQLSLPLYQPLPLLADTDDWRQFLTSSLEPGIGLACNEGFLRRILLPGAGAHRIAAHIEADLFG